MKRASDCENKVVWKPRRERVRGWPQVQADKKLPLSRVTSCRVRATKMCPLLSSFLPFLFSPCQPPQNVSSRRLFRIRFGIHSYDVASVPQGIRTFRLLFASSRRSAVLFKLAYSHVPLRGEDRPEK